MKICLINLRYLSQQFYIPTQESFPLVKLQIASNKNYFNIIKQNQFTGKLKQYEKFSKDFKYVFYSNLIQQESKQIQLAYGAQFSNFMGKSVPYNGFLKKLLIQETLKFILRTYDCFQIINKIKFYQIIPQEKKKLNEIQHRIIILIFSIKSLIQTQQKINKNTKLPSFQLKSKNQIRQKFLANKQYLETESYSTREQELNLLSYSSNQIYNKRIKGQRHLQDLYQVICQVENRFSQHRKINQIWQCTTMNIQFKIQAQKFNKIHLPMIQIQKALNQKVIQAKQYQIIRAFKISMTNKTVKITKNKLTHPKTNHKATIMANKNK